MPTLGSALESHPRRNLLFLSSPALWPGWPFLPLIRRRPGQEQEYGVLFDAMTACEITGFSATVFLTNLLLMPSTLDQFLALPKEVFDSPEEIEAAGWRVD
jgi:hypothetical protein